MELETVTREGELIGNAVVLHSLIHEKNCSPSLSVTFGASLSGREAARAFCVTPPCKGHARLAVEHMSGEGNCSKTEAVLRNRASKPKCFTHKHRTSVLHQFRVVV